MTLADHVELEKKLRDASAITQHSGSCSTAQQWYQVRHNRLKAKLLLKTQVLGFQKQEVTCWVRVGKKRSRAILQTQVTHVHNVDIT